VGGGELQDEEVSPYIFDSSPVKESEWPGCWQQSDRRSLWSFPDQHTRIAGTIGALRRSQTRLSGLETALGLRSSISCVSLTKVPQIGERLVIPRDSRFIDLEDGEGELKVPAGISLRQLDD
jgi:hypothetical protein